MSEEIIKIFYVDNSTGVGYRVELLSKSQEDIDAIIDTIPINRTFIEEREFFDMHECYDIMAILNDKEDRIGFLTTEKGVL